VGLWSVNTEVTWEGQMARRAGNFKDGTPCMAIPAGGIYFLQSSGKGGGFLWEGMLASKECLLNRGKADGEAHFPYRGGGEGGSSSEHIQGRVSEKKLGRHS